MRNELFALQRLKHRLEAMELARLRAKKDAGQKVSMFVHLDNDPRLAKLPRLKQAGEAVESFQARVTEIETTALLALAGDVEPPPDLEHRLSEVVQENSRVLLTIYSLALCESGSSNAGLLRPEHDIRLRSGTGVPRPGAGWAARRCRSGRISRNRGTQSKNPEQGEYDRTLLDTQRQPPTHSLTSVAV